MTVNNDGSNSNNTRSWLKPPLTAEETPVGESSLLAGVIALSESTDDLRDRVEAMTMARKGIVAFLLVALAVLTIQSAFGIVVLNKINNTNRIVTTAATPASIARADYRADKTIYCVNNRNDNRANPTVPLDPRCPQGFPQPVDDQP